MTYAIALGRIVVDILTYDNGYGQVRVELDNGVVEWVMKHEVDVRYV